MDIRHDTKHFPYNMDDSRSSLREGEQARMGGSWLLHSCDLLVEEKIKTIIRGRGRHIILHVCVFMFTQ